MARRYFVAVLLLGMGFGVLAVLPTGAAEPAADAARIAKLIEQLGSSSFEEREKAGKDLDAVGPPALEGLRKAVKSDDAEVSRRATDLVKVLEKRAESLNALKPTKVHLVFKETPVADALEVFSKKAGYTLVLNDTEGKLKERKITLDTGETTFWQAFDQFCEKAGVHEATPQEQFSQPVPLNGAFPPGGRIQLRPLPPPVIQIDQPQPALERPAPAKPEKIEEPRKDSPAFLADEKPAAKPVAPPVAAAPPAPLLLPPGGAIAAPLGRPIRPPVGGPQPGQITLIDGKPEVLPTDYSGAVRVRALAKTDSFGPAGEGEILVGLEITPEPKITWQRLVGVKVDKAVDDKDQKLGEAMIPVAPAGINQGFPGGGRFPGVALARPPVWAGGFSGGLRQTAVVRLKKGDKPSKSLKELTGSISAEVLPEPKALISTDEIMKSAGKTFKGDVGGAIKVVSVDRDDSGQVRVSFEFEQPLGYTPAASGNFPEDGPGAIRIAPAPVPLLPPLPARPQGGLQAVQVQAAPGQAIQVIQIQVGVGAAPPGRPRFGGPGANGLKLIDAKGNRVEGQTIGMELRGLPAGVAPEWVLTFPLKKDQTEAGTLTFSASKSVTVDIPFTLKDIVLP